MVVRFYGKYDETRQYLGPFAKLLEWHCIHAQYTIPYTPQQNGVMEMCNWTLIDMVWSMMNNFSLPKSLWMYLLKTSMYLLNRVPNKVVPKTPFKLWTNRKLSLRHFHVCGCSIEARVYNPQEKKVKFLNN